MSLENLKSHFKYSKSQRNGIFVLLFLIVSFQVIIFTADFSLLETPNPEKQKWLSLQAQIDSLKQQKRDYIPRIYPFNPNFITDFKGYKLGMSTLEINRLLAFRKTNKYANSAKEFQNVTKVSDSLLSAISPYFKFPDWVTNKKSSNYVDYKNNAPFKKEKIVVIDINQASQDDLIKVYGIGPALSERILKEKDKLGGFVSMEQMNDIWGLSPEVIEKLNQHFKVSAAPNLKKLNINASTVKELMQFPYFKYALAKQIVTFRSMSGEIRNIEDLTKIKDFPIDKVKIIALYLEFN
jgi:DNA uptake protein ComE-like DNA-binding protein